MRFTAAARLRLPTGGGRPAQWSRASANVPVPAARRGVYNAFAAHVLADSSAGRSSSGSPSPCSFSQVVSSTIPSGWRVAAVWNALTALSVRTPNTPSISPGLKSNSTSLRCSSATCGPSLPRASVCCIESPMRLSFPLINDQCTLSKPDYRPNLDQLTGANRPHRTAATAMAPTFRACSPALDLAPLRHSRRPRSDPLGVLLAEVLNAGDGRSAAGGGVRPPAVVVAH